MTLKKTKFETIDGIRKTFAAHNFSNEDLYELVNPNLGIITGFSDLMTQIEVLRNMNLGQTPPALGINERTDES